MELWWAEEDADYIRRRSTRYPGAMDLEPAWTQEVMADEHLVDLSPYPASAHARLRVHRLVPLGRPGARGERLPRPRR